MRSILKSCRDFFDNRIYGPEGSGAPVSFEQVRAEERAALAASAAWRDGETSSPADKSSEPSSQIGQKDLVGLAFSGGGIRSATFNLGLLQALADLRLLRRFDYLSTVSGGSYIGSWLSALIHRENLKEPEKGKPYGIYEVERRLRTAPDPRHSSKQPFEEDPAISFLRRYSNYLTPKVGLFTPDTWAVVSIYLRNLILNLTLLASGLMAILLVPRLIVAATRSVSAWHSDTALFIGLQMTVVLGTWVAVLMGASFSPLMVRAVSRSDDEVQEEPREAKADPPPSDHTWRLQAILWQLLALAVLALLVSRWLPTLAVVGSPLDWSIWIAVAYGGGWALAMASALRGRYGGSQDVKRWLGLVLTAGIAGLLSGWLLPYVGRTLAAMNAEHAWAGWVWGLPVVLLWLLLLGLLQTGLMGHGHRDHQREWMSRFGGWLLIIGAFWVLGFATVVYAPTILMALEGWVGGALASGWLVATASGLLASRSQPSGKSSSQAQSLVLAVAPYVFVVGLLAALALGLDWGVSQLSEPAAWDDFRRHRQELLAAAHSDQETRRLNDVCCEQGEVQEGALWRMLHHRHGELLDRTSGSWQLLGGMILVLLAGGAVLSWRIDVNEFSMHGFYRNRLVRCYLGASVAGPKRHHGKEPFTGFYEGDDIQLKELFPAGMAHHRRRGKPAPIHLINTSLNLVGGEELAWQERKAAPFVLSSLYCGFEPRQESSPQDPDPTIYPEGYRRTAAFSDGERDFGSSPVPLTLGSAVAISGAAASPNMGFHSSPALAFLLTIFNVRMGWWLGNPRHHRSWTRSGPFLAMANLFMELLGKTRGRSRYVYLSDGEHFENLGIYELVRRRCRWIVATDVGADPDYAFDNLGNAIRKCRADLGVEIEIDVEPIKADTESGHSTWHCAVGKIRYPLPGGGLELGTLLYIKASLTGDEPADVLAYARAQPPFPHQTTADQFFDESQFESYRRLGHHVAMEVLKDSVRAATVPIEKASKRGRKKVLKLEKLLVSLHQRWYPPSSADSQAFVRHAATLDRLFQRIRQTPQLAFLDAQIYPEWHRLLHGAELPEGAGRARADSLWLPKKAEERRQGFYYCNSLIQLMENVYLDLDLDRDFAHPDHRGWMNLFKHWSWSGMFRATWAISAATYGLRFQAFCKRRLDLDPGRVGIDRLEPPAGALPLTAKSFRQVVEARGDSFLNFLEREQIEIFLQHSQVDVADVARFELSVAGTAVGAKTVAGAKKPEKILRFGFGYALLTADDRVVLMRIQDHLRTMGLGRQALTHLLRTVGKEVWLEEPRTGHLEAAVEGAGRRQDEKAPEAEACRRFYEEFRGGETKFLALLQSVRRELEEEERNR